MIQCEICGKKVEKPVKILVENTIIFVCNECKTYGLVKKDRKKQFKMKIKKQGEEGLFNHNLLKKERIKKGLNLKKLASILNEKKSLIKRIESGETIPNLKLSNKFKSFFGKDLIVEIKKEKIKFKKTKKLTIGDVIKIRKRIN